MSPTFILENSRSLVVVLGQRYRLPIISPRKSCLSSFPSHTNIAITGETAFSHDPNYKPSHATTDKWYRTEVGYKVTLAGRVKESRWQSCLSMQSGREPRKPPRSRLPKEPKRPGPGPASYHFEDPWQVKVRLCDPLHGLGKGPSCKSRARRIVYIRMFQCQL